MIDANGREWALATQRFRDTYRGVGISSLQPIGLKVRRFAVRTTPGLNEQESIAEAMPRLREWADSEAWDTRKVSTS